MVHVAVYEFKNGVRLVLIRQKLERTDRVEELERRVSFDQTRLEDSLPVAEFEPKSVDVIEGGLGLVAKLTSRTGVLVSGGQHLIVRVVLVGQASPRSYDLGRQNFSNFDGQGRPQPVDAKIDRFFRRGV